MQQKHGRLHHLTFKDSHSVLAKMSFEAPFTSFDAACTNDNRAVQGEIALGCPQIADGLVERLLISSWVIRYRERSIIF